MITLLILTLFYSPMAHANDEQHDQDAIEWVCKTALTDWDNAQKYLTEKTERDGDYEIQVDELCDLEEEEVK